MKIIVENISILEENFGFITPSFDLIVNMRSLIPSINLMRVSNDELDKSATIKVKMTKHLELNLTQQLYTYFLRCSDLNLAYADGF
jgi:hypothetical protein